MKTKEQAEEHLDNLVEEWHTIGGPISLIDYLGMSENEYEAFIVSSEIPERFFED